MVVGNFKGTDSVIKATSHYAANLQWDIQFVTWLSPIESLWRGSSECRAASPLRLPQECCGPSCTYK